MSSIIDRDLRGITALVRVDFNVPMKNSIVQDASRIRNALPTVKFLTEGGARVVLISHMGKTNSFNMEQSLQNVIGDVEREYASGIVFVKDCMQENAVEIIKNTPADHVILMENLRFHPEEELCDLSFAKRLAGLADIYINEAFSVSHRRHASIFGVPQFLPHALGLAFQREIRMVNNFFSCASSPRTCLVGGAKLSTKVGLLKNLSKKVDKLIVGGKIAELFFFHELHHLTISEEYRRDVLEVMDNIRQSSCELITPLDWITKNSGERCDIGPRSVELFKRHIGESKIVLWNGPMGIFEESRFIAGTASLAREVARLTREGRLISIVGGGETGFVMNQLGLASDLSHVSTAGGAFLAYLEGMELPGLAAMKDASILLPRPS